MGCQLPIAVWDKRNRVRTGGTNRVNAAKNIRVTEALLQTLLIQVKFGRKRHCLQKFVLTILFEESGV